MGEWSPTAREVVGAGCAAAGYLAFLSAAGLRADGVVNLPACASAVGAIVASRVWGGVFRPRPPARGPTGSCSACGYSPVASDARGCPNCGADNPNPGIVERFAGRGMLLGLAGGAAGGGVAGYDSLVPGAVGAFGGVLIGSIPGLIAGLVVGGAAAVAARLSGQR